MAKNNFRLPSTPNCEVRYEDLKTPGQFHDLLMETPANNDQLRSIMLRHRVGFGQIRAVKAVSGQAIAEKMLGNAFARR